jgi:uncharacterized phiE125 gp8 family phage protein
MRVATASEDTLIGKLIEAATLWAENYTGMDVRANSWKLWLDVFATPIVIDRRPIATDGITSIKHNVDASPVTISSDDYILKRQTLWSEIWPAPNVSWPSNTDDGEHQIEIAFSTAAPPAGVISRVEVGLMRHVAYLYENRGDLEGSDIARAARDSGAVEFYTFGVPRY